MNPKGLFTNTTEDCTAVINRRGEIVKVFAEILIELGIVEYQRVTTTDEINIGRANYIKLCAETSPEKMLSTEQNSTELIE